MLKCSYYYLYISCHEQKYKNDILYLSFNIITKYSLINFFIFSREF